MAEKQQALIQQGIRDIETLQHVKAYAEKMLQVCTLLFFNAVAVQ
jgi:hypothetical protein